MSSAAILRGPLAWWEPRGLGSRVIVAPRFLPYTVTATSEATGHPATALTRLGTPFRTWRSTGVGASQDLVCDLGVAQPLSGVFLEHANVSAAALAASLDGVSWTSLGTVAIGRDRRIGRRHTYAALTTFSHRYLKVTLAPADRDSGATYLELGTLALCYPTTVLQGVRRPLRWIRREALEELALAGGGVEVIGAGQPYLEATLSMLERTGTVTGGAAAPGGGGTPEVEGEYGWGTGGWGDGGWPAGTYTTPASSASTSGAGGASDGASGGPDDQGAIFLLVENQGDPTHAYAVRRINPEEVVEHFSVTERPNWAVREAV